MLTKSEIDELERMHKEATPGEWHCAMPACDCDPVTYDTESSIETSLGGEAFIPHLPHYDAYYIVRVRNLLPRIIAALREKSGD